MASSGEDSIDPDRWEEFAFAIERGWIVFPLVGVGPLLREPFSQCAQTVEQLNTHWGEWVRLAKKKISRTDPGEFPYLTLNPGVMTGEVSDITVLEMKMKSFDIYSKKYKVQDKITGTGAIAVKQMLDFHDLFLAVGDWIAIIYRYMSGVLSVEFDGDISGPHGRRLDPVRMNIRNDMDWTFGPGSVMPRAGEVVEVHGLYAQHPPDMLENTLREGSFEEHEFRLWVRTKLSLPYRVLDRIVVATRVEEREGKKDLIRFAREVYTIVDEKEDLLTVLELYAKHFHPKPRSKNRQQELLAKIVTETELPTEELVERKVLGVLEDHYPERVSGSRIHKTIGGRREYVFQALHRLRDRGEVRQIGQAGWVWIAPDDR